MSERVAPPVAGRDGELRIDGMRHAYVEWGPPSGHAVVCLHGWLDNAYSFAPLAAQLPGLRLIALELAGHGHSDHRAKSVPYHYLDWVRDTLVFARALGLAELSLLGHSMGAGVAALAAGTDPSRITRLALIEGTGPRSARSEELPLSLQGHIEHDERARQVPVRTRPAAFATAVRARLVSSPLSRGAAELLALRGTRAVPGGVLWRNDRRLSRLLPAQLDEAQVCSFLGRIACPTLLVRASAGGVYDPALIAARLARIADVREQVVEGRHHVHMDHPERLAPLLSAFLTGVAAPSP